VLLAAFLWKRVTPQGGVACIAGGMGTIVTLAILGRIESVAHVFVMTIGDFDFDFASSDYIVIPGVLVSVGLLLTVSLLTKPSPKEKWEPFFEGGGQAE
jgi:Na+/proline symporter